jgi:hypothetical protein
MNKLFVFFVSIPALCFTMTPGFGQDDTKVKSQPMAADAVPLKGVTVGFAIGFNYLFESPKEYFLSTDAQHNLHVQDLGHSNFVVSTVLSIRLGKPAVQLITDKGHTRKKIVDLNEPGPITVNRNGDKVQSYNETKKSRWSLILGLNLVDISSDVAFNKSIDGGIGLGFSVNEFALVSLSLDMVRHRQMRDFIVDNYLDKPIPNGADVFNALDQANNDLFHNKYFAGLSFKLVFTINNQ